MTPGRLLKGWVAMVLPPARPLALSPALPGAAFLRRALFVDMVPATSCHREAAT
jgi:hypothetical protein